MGSKQVVIALFPDEAAADAAAASLKAWDEADKDVKLKAIAVMVLDEDGEFKTDKLGRHYGIVKGAVEGTVLTILLAPIGGPLGLTVLGGIIGGVSHKGLGLHSDDRDRLSAALTNGQAAIGVLVKNDDAATVSDKLTELGGTPETHDVTDDVESAATTAAESAPA